MRHIFPHWTAIRDTGLQRAMIGPGEIHATCSRCKVTVKRTPAIRPWLGQPWKPAGPIKYLVGGKWVSKSPECKRED